MPAGCSMNAMIRIGLPQRGQTRGSTSYTCLMSRAHARFTAESAGLAEGKLPPCRRESCRTDGAGGEDPELLKQANLPVDGKRARRDWSRGVGQAQPRRLSTSRATCSTKFPASAIHMLASALSKVTRST